VLLDQQSFEGKRPAGFVWEKKNTENGYYEDWKEGEKGKIEDSPVGG